MAAQMRLQYLGTKRRELKWRRVFIFNHSRTRTTDSTARSDCAVRNLHQRLNGHAEAKTLNDERAKVANPTIGNVPDYSKHKEQGGFWFA